jgi:hypothetical protein
LRTDATDRSFADDVIAKWNFLLPCHAATTWQLVRAAIKATRLAEGGGALDSNESNLAQYEATAGLEHDLLLSRTATDDEERTSGGAIRTRRSWVSKIVAILGY